MVSAGAVALGPVAVEALHSALEEEVEGMDHVWVDRVPGWLPDTASFAAHVEDWAVVDRGRLGHERAHALRHTDCAVAGEC